MEVEYGVVMLCCFQVEFFGVVQQYIDVFGGEVSVDDIWILFVCIYFDMFIFVCYCEYYFYEYGNIQGIRFGVDIDG